MSVTTSTAFDELVQAAKPGSVVALSRTIPADLLTPVAAYLKIAANARYSFLLESVEGGEQLARYSFLGVDPELVVRGRGKTTELLSQNGKEQLANTTAIDYLREHFRSKELTNASQMAPFAGGAVGYVGYSAAHWFDPAMHAIPSTCDDAVFMLFRTLLAFDHARQQVQIRSIIFADETNGSVEKLRELHDAAVARIDNVVAQLRCPVELPIATGVSAAPVRFESNFERKAFERSVEEAQELIAAGECYQVVLSQRFSRKTKADAVAIYRALRATNPSPYMYLLKLDEESLIGASPEMLVRCRGNQLDYRPIAGTRPRGQNDEIDEQLATELLADEKECSEHVMLVDLGRNDLGRVATYGTVHPEKLMKIEKYSHVQHIVTELTAQLRPECDRFDALGACFPAGTVSGAPKIRAMQAIADLEGTPRGVYSGAVVYADYAGNLDSCIAIRTIELRNGVAEVQAGAGIVADSVPSSEYEETINKSRALQQAVAIAEAGV